MKKILFPILCFGIAMSLCAQQRSNPVRQSFIPYSDIRLGIGVKPFESAYVLENIGDWGMDIEPFDWIDFNAKNYYSGARYTTNALFCEYIYQANKWFGVGGTLTYFAYFNNYYSSASDAYEGCNLVQHVSLYPTVRLTWLNNQKFSVYSAFGIGPRMITETDRTTETRSTSLRGSIGAQITLFGFTVGRNIYGFTDLCTIGTQGVLTGGIGYRFVSHHK